ncbi:transglycosylase SLT domain-containing protein [Thermosulfurimonas sp. F29]|uniref:transglycosylase SLT domain-containing protein n=1 Tax=Thermosulfurimonas sp. F29 TaxID=2867247 RepID=UPI001C8374BB|nr:transglycosylase SLT domain-containing protein [Thermosulfurimonas sp. F29]MBX6424206.1 lytic transglycosylase domain-containing protein [Thermosulfurimonas sp. F29]
MPTVVSLFAGVALVLCGLFLHCGAVFAQGEADRLRFETEVRYVRGVIAHRYLPARCLRATPGRTKEAKIDRLARDIVRAVWEVFTYAGPIKPVERPESLLALVLAVAEKESDFCPTATSRRGAVGLMQVNYPYWRKRYRTLSVETLYRPYHNVLFGTGVLLDSIKRKGLVRGLCEYHGDRHCRRLSYVEEVLVRFLEHERNLARLASLLDLIATESGRVGRRGR